MSNTPDATSTTATWYACGACAGQGVWHPDRQDVVCVSCGGAIVLPPPPPGPVHTFDLVTHLRDAPENRRTWTPQLVQLPCPMCGSPVTFAPAVWGTGCLACGTPLLRPLQEGDAPLAPNGVVPFTVSETDAGDRLRAWSTNPVGGRMGRTRIEIVSLHRTYLPYWRFSAHVHCPFRGAYQRTNRHGDTVDVPYDGVIDEEYGDTARGGTSLPEHLWELEPMKVDEAVPFDRRYLAGATVEHYAVGLWDAWDDVHARIDARINRTMRKTGDGSMPDEVWPTWSRQAGCLILVPLYVAAYRVHGQTWQAVVHGTTAKVAGTAPRNEADRPVPRRRRRGFSRAIETASAILSLGIVLGVVVLAIWGAWRLLFG